VRRPTILVVLFLAAMIALFVVVALYGRLDASEL
jgi:hypothetical protein